MESQGNARTEAKLEAGSKENGVGFEVGQSFSADVYFASIKVTQL